MPPGDAASAGPLADRLNHLFATVRRPGGKPYSNHEVAKAVTASGAATLSHTYLHQLRTGSRGAPGRTSRDKLAAIAAFFGVPDTYFDSAEVAVRVDEQLDLLALLRDRGVRAVATHAAGLPRPFLDAILTLLTQTRTVLGLPPTPPGPAAEIPVQRDES